MSAPHADLLAEVAALTARVQALEADLLAVNLTAQLAQKRLVENAQGGPRYARNVPDPWAPGGAGHEHP